MWPMLLDYTKDESKRILRRLELEAYASIISVFRAQGDLSKEKKSILQDLQQSLSISTERHRAEVRRAVNDEKLATIAENISGSMGTAEWQVEGRRLVPLMPRLVPQTAFTSTANQAASAMMEKNATLPPPSSTCNKDGPTATIPKTTRPPSPSSNVVVLPSGTSIHIKGMLNQEEEEDLSAIPGRRSSQRSLSTDSQNAASSVSTQTPRVTYTTASSTATGSSPVKITISKSPQGRPINVQSNSQPPKVILVTSAGPAPTVVQRSMSVPVVRSQPSPMSSVYPGLPASSSGGVGPGHVSAPRPSVIVSGASLPSSGVQQVVSAYPGVVTTTSGANLVSTTVTMPTSSLGGNPAMFSPALQMGLGKIRPRIVPRQRYPAMVSSPPQPQHQKPGVVLPMGPQLVSPLPQAVSLGSTSGPIVSAPGPPQQTQYSSAAIQVNQLPSSSALHTHHSTGVQVKTLNKPTIQIKQEGGMKIITQGGSSKILPKPSQLANSSGAPVVMVNTGQGTQVTTTGITMLPRSISTYTAHSGGKVLNITTPGGRVIATTTKATNVVTVNPKTLHLTAVKSGSVSKPNVIVVQKTQHARFQNPLPGNIRTVTTSALPGAIDKELMGLVHHKDSHGRHVLTTSNPPVSAASGARPGERRVIITTSGGGGEVNKPVSIIHRGRSDSEGKTSSLLAELIQAAGIMPSDASVETVAQGTDPYDFDHPEGNDNRVGGQHQIVPSSSGQVVFRHAQPPSSGAGGAFQGRSNPHQLDDSNMDSMAEDKGSSQDSDSGAEQVFTLEQAMSIMNNEVVDLTENDPSLVVTPSFPVTTQPTQQIQAPAVTSNATASILPSVLPSAVPQPQPQPKVSILAKSRLLSGVVKEPPGSSLTSGVNIATPVTPVSEPSLSGVVTVVSPEEGLKEGQLDTQTGLFYQVGSSAAIKVRAPQQIPTDAAAVPQPLPLPLSTSVVIVAGSTTGAAAATTTKTATSLSSTLPISSQAYRHTPTLPATVTTPSPLTVVSTKMPPSTLLSSSLPPAGATKPSTSALPGSGFPPLDLLSSSLAQAQINFHNQEGEDGVGDGDNGNVDEQADNEHSEDEHYEVYEEGGDDDVDPQESSKSSQGFQSASSLTDTCPGGAGRPGMAEVLREETAKDGTLILTVSNPASSQPEICVPVSSTALTLPPSSFSSSSSSSSVPSSLHHSPMLVSLPSQLSRAPAPAIITPQVQAQPLSSSGHGQFYSVLDPQPANPALTGSRAPIIQTPALGLLPAAEMASLPATPLRMANTPSPGEQPAQQVGVLPIAVSVEPSGSVITFNLDDLSSQQVLSQGEAETNTDDLGSAGSDPDSQGESLSVRTSKRKRKHNSGFEEPAPQTNNWVKAAASLLLRVARFKGSARDKNEIPAAEWFTFPVDPMDAPDYYTVIQQPMDFSTMRKKLETGQYTCFEEFQSDMDLIRSNCYLYNSEGTKVRRDCDEVMAFYQTELLKLQGKQALNQYSSPLKKLKEDKSPQKH